MEKFKNFLNKVKKMEKFARGDVNPENSTMKEVAEFQSKEKEIQEYEKSFDDNIAA